MNKILAVASFEKQKYFLENEFFSLPDIIKEELKVICSVMAEKLHCTFIVSFAEKGDIVFELIKMENDFDFDDIGADLEIKKIQIEKKDLLKSLKLWFIVFKTENGEKFKHILLKN